jgi:hypothetical protein
MPDDREGESHHTDGEGHVQFHGRLTRPQEEHVNGLAGHLDRQRVKAENIAESLKYSVELNRWHWRQGWYWGFVSGGVVVAAVIIGLRLLRG